MLTEEAGAIDVALDDDAIVADTHVDIMDVQVRAPEVDPVRLAVESSC